MFSKHDCNSVSLTNLHVISKVKLLALFFFCFVSVSVLFLIGVHGPPVSKRKFTGPRFRCEHGFTANMLSVCASNKNFQLNLPSNLAEEDIFDKTLTAITARKNESQNFLKCLFDSCNATTTQILSPPAKDHKIHTVHYKVPLYFMTRRNRYFYVEIQFPNPNFLLPDHSLRITSSITVKGAKFRKLNSWKEIDLRQPHSELIIPCKYKREYCNPTPILRIGEIDFGNYEINVLLHSVKPLPLNGTDAFFFVSHGNSNFTDWLIVFKIGFLILSVAFTAVFLYKLQKISKYERIVEQKWVAILMIFLILFNDPFFSLETNYGGSLLKVSGLIFQVNFLVVLLFFWLTSFEKIYIDMKDLEVKGIKFYAPKCIFFLVFWLLTIIIFTFVKLEYDNDPTWNVKVDVSLFSTCEIIAAILLICYFMRLLYLFMKLVPFFVDIDDRLRYFLYFSAIVFCISVFGFVSGSYSAIPKNAGHWSGFYGLFNVYLVALSYLYAPSTSSIIVSKQSALQESEELSPRRDIEFAMDIIGDSSKDVSDHAV